MGLAQELVDAIVDLVDDTASLKSCSLAATPFVARSQRHLFRSVRLETSRKNGDSSSIRALHNCLIESPHIASYIRHLILDVSLLSHSQPLVSSILCSVSNLARLDFNGDSLQWRMVSEKLRIALLVALRRPSLQQFHLTQLYDIPPSFILDVASSVPEFSVKHLGVDSAGGGAPAALCPMHPVTSVTHLTLLVYSPAVTELCAILVRAPACLARIEQVRIELGAHTLPFLIFVARTLLHLVLNEACLISPSLMPPAPHLPHASRLHTVEFSYLLPHDPQMPGSLSAFFAGMAASFPHLELIVINCIRRFGFGSSRGQMRGGSRRG
ncbi:hypothetical protein C8J57DRAFT_1622318 [Mycena rebaudengoi]|nr:hypothetical protein C8J57DRAFT_1622318 [Mycena rebaudengoi]